MPWKFVDEVEPPKGKELTVVPLPLIEPDANRRAA